MKCYNNSNFKRKNTTKNKHQKVNSQILSTNRKKSEQQIILKSKSFARIFPNICVKNTVKSLFNEYKSKSNLDRIINENGKCNNLIKSKNYYFKNTSNKKLLKKEVHKNIENKKKVILNKPKNSTKQLRFIPTIHIDLEENFKNKNIIIEYSNNSIDNQNIENLYNNLTNIEREINKKISLISQNNNFTNVSRKKTMYNLKYNQKSINTSYIFQNKYKNENPKNIINKKILPLISKKKTENKKIKHKLPKDTKSLLDNIKSTYIFKQILSNILTKKIYSLFKYNKKEQKRFNINMDDYNEFCKIEIELIPESSSGKFINIINEQDEKYYHIYFNNDENEINRNSFYENEFVENIRIIIDYQVKSFKELFHNCLCIESINFKKFNGNNITDMSYMFYNCTSLNKLNLSNFDTSNVIKMDNMFRQCTSLNEINLSNFNTRKVISLSNMFFQCTSLKKINLSNFNTDKLRSMAYIFFQCSSLQELDLSNFDTSKVKDMSYMFCECISLKKLNISNFDTTNAINMSYMFCGCSSLKKLNVSNFNTSNVTNMNNMFQGCSSLKEIFLLNFNTDKVIDMSNMFHGCTSLKEINLSNFNTDNVTNINKMFYGCLSLKNLNFSNLNTKNIIDMSNMFVGCPDKLKQEMKSRYPNIRDEAFE